jgi:hypothetical protein
VFDCSLRSLRCSLGCRRLRRIWRNGKALFCHLLLQIGGANIEDPPTSSSLADEKRVGSLLLSTAARDPRSDCSLRSLPVALCLIARSAPCDVRWAAAVFVGSGGTESVVPPSSPADRRREHRESAYFVVARRREACRLTPPQHGGVIRGLNARCAQRSQLTAEPSASPAFARTRRSSRARRSASKEEMLAPSSSKAASQAASSRAARSTVARWCVL